MTICPTCGYDTLPEVADKVPVEQLREGDLVRAVLNGPFGRVTDVDCAGWTLIKYPTSARHNEAIMNYKHGKDRLYRLTDYGDLNNGTT